MTKTHIQNIYGSLTMGQLEDSFFLTFFIFRWTAKELSHTYTKTWLFLKQEIRPFQNWSIYPNISCQSKDMEANCIGYPMTISKGKSL